MTLSPARHPVSESPMEWALGGAAFGVGIVVGLTGMGGGALMTPMLVLFFGVPPLAAVSSDLVASAVMKPVGSVVHLRHGTVNMSVVRWLMIGSVPSAFGAVLLLKTLGPDGRVQEAVKLGLGTALLLTAGLLAVRAVLRLVERARLRDGRTSPHPPDQDVRVRRSLTVALGAVGGMVVGLTSVGSGSIVIIGLMMLYPGLKAGQLVGTDLVQAVPLVAAAALGHSLFGDLDLAVTLPLVLGSVPGVYLGAQLSARLSGGFIRRALAFVLLASGLKMIGLDNRTTAVLLLLALVLGPLLWMWVRHRFGFTALARLRLRPRTWLGLDRPVRSRGALGR